MNFHTSIHRITWMPYFCLALSLALTDLPPVNAQETSTPQPTAPVSASEAKAADSTEAAAAKDAVAPLNKKDVQTLIADSQTILTKAQDTLRILSAKLPSVVTDNEQFRRLDKTVELCREDIYPAETAVTKLKTEPRRLHDLVKLYLGMRMLQLHCQLLADRLMGDEGASQASNAVFDITSKVGRIALKLHPYVYRVVDAYEAGVPISKLDTLLPLQEATPPAK